jgi:hypothetical protein
MYEFDDDVPYQKNEQRYDKEELTQDQPARNWPEVLVRVIGIVLLLVGLWASIQVLLEALRLYRDPVKIEQLASAIEHGSNLDKNLALSSQENSGGNDAAANASGLNKQAIGENIRLTYFVAWIVALLILMLVAMIAFSCIRTGSELVLQDRQMKRYMHLLVKELGNLKISNK